MTALPLDTDNPGKWDGGELPPNVQIGAGSLITSEFAFKRFHSRHDPGLVIGSNSTLDGVRFSVGQEGRILIGDYCYFTSVVLLAECELVFGSYVVIGFNTTIADTDFHPVAPAERIADAIALSPLGKSRTRPPIRRERVTIGDDVWIGPNTTILKGVHIGDGAFIEPGSVITRDIPAGSRVIGNPPQVISSIG